MYLGDFHDEQIFPLGDPIDEEALNLLPMCTGVVSPWGDVIEDSSNPL